MKPSEPYDGPAPESKKKSRGYKGNGGGFKTGFKGPRTDRSGDGRTSHGGKPFGRRSDNRPHSQPKTAA